MNCDVAIVGGGFYGLRIATMVAAAGRTATLFEREHRFGARASFSNQARVHGGYHYPRSVLTAMRARTHFRRFEIEFASAIDRSFQHVYAVARHQSLIRASEFAGFCRRIHAPIAAAPRALATAFDPNYIEQSFLVEETVFNSHTLLDAAIRSADAAGVQFRAAAEVVAIEPGTARRLRVRWRAAANEGATEADWVVNATYASMNELLHRSGVAPVPLLHELTEIAIVHPPANLIGYGVTVVDGPFWSCVPFPVHHAYSLSHVRYTPHERWSAADDPSASRSSPAHEQIARTSHMPLMRRDATRMLPAMRDASHVTSLWAVKTVLPRSATDDSRPILVHRHADAPGLVSVLGAKIDSVYDVEDELRDVIVDN